MRDSVRASDLTVQGLTIYVHDGAVSLYGTVATAAVREQVLALVTHIPGVRRIVDHLRLGDA